MDELKDKLSSLSGHNISELDRCVIQDKNGEEIGRLIDCTLRKTENGMEITKFVVGGSKLEEFLERIKVKPDIDPVFPVSVIEQVSPQRIQLSVGKDELKSTHLDEDVLEEDEYKLTSLRKTRVIDSEEADIGRVIDLKFDQDTWHLILGDSVAMEWAESVGLQPDIDFLISQDAIKEFARDCIVLSENKENLKSTFIVNLAEYQNKSNVRDKTGNLLAQNPIYFPAINR